MKNLNHLQLALVATTALLLTACNKPAAVDSAMTMKASDSKIVGGVAVDIEAEAEIAQSTVALGSLEVGVFCTASLIADNMIVTAAHCVDVVAELSPTDRLVVVFNHDLTARKLTVRPIVDGFQHPQWAKRQNEKKDTADVAVLKFRGSLPAGYKAATLLEDSSLLENDAEVILAGYGVLSMRPKIQATELMKVSVVLTDKAFSATEVLFAQHEGGGACHGDSGGPAFTKVDGKVVLFGVTSRAASAAGGATCLEGSIYTNLASKTHSSFLKAAIAELNKPAEEKAAEQVAANQ